MVKFFFTYKLRSGRIPVKHILHLYMPMSRLKLNSRQFQVLHVAKRLKAGTVFVNTYQKTDVAAPFGGYKQSGFGKDLGNLRHIWLLASSGK